VSQSDSYVELTVRGRISRRQAMRWVMSAVAASALPAAGQEVGRTVTPQERAARQTGPIGLGYGMDPDLMREHKPGAFWPLTFDEGQRRTARALADLIIPRDHLGAAASEVGVVEMVDEWISAPYPAQQWDRPVVVEGLAWLEGEAKRRFGNTFAQLSNGDKRAICDEICFVPAAQEERKKQAIFFSRFRSICAGAYYATPPGWQAIGYVGNVALGSFEGPPPEVLKMLGVTQTVL
jgi:hypothetical protein